MQRFAVLLAPADGEKVGRVAIDPKVVFVRISVEMQAKTATANRRDDDLKRGWKGGGE